jgi:hypothetical protein
MVARAVRPSSGDGEDFRRSVDVAGPRIGQAVTGS